MRSQLRPGERRVVSLAAIFLGAILLGILGAACNGGSPAPAAAVDDALPVRTVTVVRGDAAPAVRASGLVAGKEEARLGFKMGGVVAEVLVDEGTRVAKGQRLATLKQAEASARSVQAQRGVEKAARDLERSRTLHADGVGTLQRLQDAQTALDVARADLTMASFEQEHAVIVAPDDGIVLARMAEANEMVQPGQPILLFKSGGQGFVVRVGLADRDVVRVALGDPAQLRAAAWPERALTGRVTQIAAAASPATGTFDVEVAVDPSDAALLSGMHARVEIEPSRRDPVAWVPIDALLEGDGDHGSVYTLDAARSVARRVPVQLAFLQDGRAALRGSLEGVDEVVTDGAAWLRDGARVRVLPADVAAQP